MAKKIVSKKLVNSTSKISNIADLLLTEEGHGDWEIDQIHITRKATVTAEKVVCKWVEENGEWVFKCENEY